MNGPLEAGLSSVLLHLTWQGVLVALAARLALRVAGPSASIARYRIAIGALGVLALAPAGTLARRGGWLADASPGLAAVLPAAPDATASADLPASADRVPETSPRGGALPAGPAAPGAWIARTWRAAEPWLLLAWLLGALLSFARLAVGIARLHGLRRRSRSAPAALVREAARLARRLGLARLPEVRVSAESGMPLTFGALRPLVLLPSRFVDRMPADQARLVLAHELAHVARGDYAANLAQCVVESLCFFHPAVHLLSAIAREEREHCADELAASAAGDRRQLASALVALEELVGARGSRNLAPAAGGGTLFRRIERLVTPAARPGRWHAALAAGVLAIAPALAVLATPASARIRAAEQPLPAPAPDPDGGGEGGGGFSVVWEGIVGPGERLRVRNLAGPIRVVPAQGNRGTVRARVSGGGVADLVFAPSRDEEGPAVCALRAAHGRCDAEGSTWFGTGEEMHRALIDLEVELPAGAGVTAASFDGDLVLDGVSGDAEARTGSGVITARIAGARDDRALELHTGAGTVQVALPSGFGGRLDARLSDGAVEPAISLTSLRELSPGRFRARLGPPAGGNRLNVSSGRGSLILTHSP